MTARLLLALAVLLTIAGCASSGGATADVSPDVITSEEIAAFEETYPAADAYELVERLHRTWLNTRIAGAEVQVFQGASRLGSVEALRQFPTSAVGQIERLDPRTAQNRYGRQQDLSSGALVLTLR
jgi:ABC-type glycerol-3-phosphate transport system substrate-binding protein